MDWPAYIQQKLPSVIRGVAGIVASRVAVPAAPVDPTPEFMQKRLDLLARYQEELAEKRPLDMPGAVTSAGVVECPYCQLEELAGIVRNHLLFVAQECKDNEMAPATGGMIPKAKATLAEFMMRCDQLEADSHIKLVVQLAHMKAQELQPKLEWISSCDEAREAASLADEVWHRAAKATQMYYAETPDHPYA